VVGQAEAVSAAARALQRAGAGLRDGRRPVAALLFCGPTGVGKTHLAKVQDQMLCQCSRSFVSKNWFSGSVSIHSGPSDILIRLTLNSRRWRSCGNVRLSPANRRL